MVKAAREAKVHTSWTSPDTGFEEALVAFAGAVLDEQRSAPFLDDFLTFARRVARPGMYNSLGLTLLKLTAPGVPDFYQGNELWRFDLVDPDNRRAVDFQRRRAHLAFLSAELGQMGAAALAQRLVSEAPDGRIKLYLIWRALALRRADPDLFQAGEYLPLPVHGEHAAHVVAFARRAAGRVAVTVVPRLMLSLLGDVPDRAPGDAPWGDTRVALPHPRGTSSPGALRDCFTGVRRDVDAAHGELAVSDLLAGFPVALLVSDDGADA